MIQIILVELVLIERMMLIYIFLVCYRCSENILLSSFLIFDKMIGRFWAASSRKDKGTEECPLQWQMLGMVQYGYLILTERMAQQVWGEDHPLYLAIKAKLDFTQARAARGRFPKPTAKKFRLMFDLTQADLLEWAGVPEDKAIELPK